MTSFKLILWIISALMVVAPAVFAEEAITAVETLKIDSTTQTITALTALPHIQGRQLSEKEIYSLKQKQTYQKILEMEIDKFDVDFQISVGEFANFIPALAVAFGGFSDILTTNKSEAMD